MLNVLKFYTQLEDVYTQEIECLTLSASNYLTAFWVSLEKMTSFDLSDIDITLRGHDDIDFKTVIDATELYTSNGYLYYKGIKQLTSNLQGNYYIEITDGLSYLFSNMILFDAGQQETAEGDYVEFYVNAGAFSFFPTGTGNLVIDWGDGTTETVAQNQLISKTILNTSIVKIYFAQRITELVCNSPLLTKIRNMENFTSLTVLDYSSTNVSWLNYPSTMTTLEEVRFSSTPLPNGSTTRPFGGNPIEIIEANSIGSHFNGTSPYYYVSCWQTLRELHATHNELERITYSDQGLNTFTELEIVNLSNNNFVEIPKVGMNYTRTNLSSPIKQWIIQSNDLRGEDWSDLRVFLDKVTTKIDLKNNAFSTFTVDRTLIRIAERTLPIKDLYLDLSGASPSSGVLMGIPTDGMYYYSIVAAGENYEVGDTLTVTDGDNGGTGSSWRVETVGNSGEILSLSMIAAGSGYNAIENFTGGSGTNGIIEFYSPRVWLVYQGVELYTNALYDVELLPDYNIIDYQTKAYLKDEDYYLTWL